MEKLSYSISAAERLEVEAELRLAELREEPIVKLLSGLGQIADQPPLISVSTALFGVGLLMRNRRLAEAGLRVLTATLITTAVKSTIEGSVRRTRPNAVLDGVPYEWARGGSKRKAKKSFPSGHTADAVTAARALARIYPERAGVLAAAAGLIGLVQLPSGAHYPSDVAAGALVGLLGEKAADMLVGVLLENVPEVVGAGSQDP